MGTSVNRNRRVVDRPSIVAAILLGDAVPFLGGSAGVVSRITELISALGNEGVVGLVALGVILYIFNKKNDI